MRADNYLIVRLDQGDEVIPSLTDAVKAEGIRSAAVISFVGALKGCRLILRKGLEKDIDTHVEAVGNGNISYFRGSPMVHLHVSVGSDAGTWVGHLLRGVTDVFCEAVIAALPAALVRSYSEELAASGVTVPYVLDLE